VSLSEEYRHLTHQGWSSLCLLSVCPISKTEQGSYINTETDHLRFTGATYSCFFVSLKLDKANTVQNTRDSMRLLHAPRKIADTFHFAQMREKHLRHVYQQTVRF